MTSCPYTTVLLDYGGVIAEEGFLLGVRRLALEHGLAPETLWQAGMGAIWDSGYVTGKGTEADFWTLFKSRSGLVGDENRWREDILKGFVVRPWMLTLADRLRGRGLKAAVLSDQTDWLDLLDARQRFSGHFDRVFNSYRCGMTKRDLAFFELALNELGADPRATLFVDDNPDNVRRAASLGITAICYQTREGFEEAFETVCPGATA